ncbi:MAG: hypothetical protein Q8L97_02660 [Nitrosomonas sp.]|nr:hypothetical protein [Nitrosomonas sp.]
MAHATILVAILVTIFGSSYTLHIVSPDSLSESSLLNNPSVDCNTFSNATYTSRYPYIVIDKKYRHNQRIRAIAYKAIWETEKCIKVGNHFELYGTEKTLHHIEIKLSDESGDYKHVADGLAVYRSKVTFDNKNIHRVILDIPDEPEIYPEHQRKKLEDLVLQKGKNNQYLNHLIINPTTGIEQEEFKKYEQAVDEYINIRKDMHNDELSNKTGNSEGGCNTLTAIFDNRDKSRTLTIAFLCPKHSRIMIRKL